MGIKSKNGMSSVNTPTMGLHDPIKIVSGKHIVMKPLNTHRAQPGLKGKIG